MSLVWVRARAAYLDADKKYDGLYWCFRVCVCGQATDLIEFLAQFQLLQLLRVYIWHITRCMEFPCDDIAAHKFQFIYLKILAYNADTDSTTNTALGTIPITIDSSFQISFTISTEFRTEPYPIAELEIFASNHNPVKWM